MLNDLDLSALWVTLRLAGMTVLVLLIVGTPIAWWLAHTRSRWRTVVEAVVALPIVLPPTVLGFYILVALGPYGPIGRLTGVTFAFTFWGLVVASAFYSMPFVVQPLHAAFEAIGRAPLEAAWSLRASPFDAFVTVASPMALRGYISGIVLGFAHTMGEFGVVLMVGGSIPGKTRVLSTTVFDHVEVMEYQQAHVLSAAMLIFSFLVLLGVYIVNRKFPIHVS
ncbi:molybdenum ABC transporter permease subunit [Nitrospira sp. KM1]|uniref:molybdate ABC transporter permease subunit n=1 Tax=Nitrospira sp. KM1 TaxID=1936990 RepID=UPI0013A7AD46|nr:molybdate ABC transporter permease subunit [Nitrospira sp. KM1]BCA57095.1 molybdenum ABC transporter permease subunit [Nitrospira sp. KM1]